MSGLDRLFQPYYGIAMMYVALGTMISVVFRRTRSWMTCADVAKRCGVSKQAARYWIDILAASGEIEGRQAKHASGWNKVEREWRRKCK